VKDEGADPALADLEQETSQQYQCLTDASPRYTIILHYSRFSRVISSA
jgi:hypothetical protein